MRECGVEGRWKRGFRQPFPKISPALGQGTKVDVARPRVVERDIWYRCAVIERGRSFIVFFGGLPGSGEERGKEGFFLEGSQRLGPRPFPLFFGCASGGRGLSSF